MYNIKKYALVAFSSLQKRPLQQAKAFFGGDVVEEEEE